MKYANPIQRLVSASRYSLEGLVYALRNEQAFRYEFVALAVICLVLVIMDLPSLWSAVLFGAWLIVMCFELVNSAVEKAFDLITEERHPVVKAAKDMLSTSVFIAICLNVVLWIVAIISHPIF